MVSGHEIQTGTADQELSPFDPTFFTTFVSNEGSQDDDAYPPFRAIEHQNPATSEPTPEDSANFEPGTENDLVELEAIAARNTEPKGSEDQITEVQAFSPTQAPETLASQIKPLSLAHPPKSLNEAESLKVEDFEYQSGSGDFSALSTEKSAIERPQPVEVLPVVGTMAIAQSQPVKRTERKPRNITLDPGVGVRPKNLKMAKEVKIEH